MLSEVAVDPATKLTAATPLLPEPFAVAPAAGASRFMCSEPADKAIDSFRQARKRNDTVAPMSSRICTCGTAGLPTLSTFTVLADFRESFVIQPRSIHGA